MSKEEFLSIAESYYSEFNTLTDSANFYDYEVAFCDLMQKIGRDYMEKQLNEGLATTNRRKKKDHNPTR
jgi:hypothetical protein